VISVRNRRILKRLKRVFERAGLRLCAQTLEIDYILVVWDDAAAALRPKPAGIQGPWPSIEAAIADFEAHSECVVVRTSQATRMLTLYVTPRER